MATSDIKKDPRANAAKKEMEKNSAAWHTADAATRKTLEARNQELGKTLGASYDSKSGSWSDSSGSSLYSVKPPTNTGSYTPTGGNTPSGSSYTPLGNFGDSLNNFSEQDSTLLNQYKSAYERAKASGDKAGMDSAHASAEELRAKYNYSGGQDGSQYISLSPQKTQEETVRTVDGIMQGYSQLAADARQMGDEGLVALAAQWDSMLAMLDGVEQQITDQISSQMNGDDPGMRNAIRLIKEEADRMRKETLEELNARGLVQSGVYARTLSEMNNSELSQVQSAISSRFGDLQTQLNNAIISLAQTRIQALGTNQSAMNNMMMNTQNNVLATGLQGLNAQTTMRGQDMQDNRAQQELNLNRDAMQQSNTQFYDKLNMENTQFYSALNKPTGNGGATGPSPWEIESDNYQRQMYEQELTNSQVKDALLPGGMVDQLTQMVKDGRIQPNELPSLIQNSGNTQAATNTIMQYITINTRSLPQNTSTGYTPTNRYRSTNLPPGRR